MVKIHRGWLIAILTALIGATTTLVLSRGEDIGAKATIEYVDERNREVKETVSKYISLSDKELLSIKVDVRDLEDNQSNYITRDEFTLFYDMLKEVRTDVRYIKNNP